MPAGTTSIPGPSEKVVRIDGYIVTELPDDRVRIGPYTFSPDGESVSMDSSLFIQGPTYEVSGYGMDLHGRIAKALYQKYLELKSKEKKLVKN